ncbi:hypothetical protein AAA799P11_01503, partial [Marine Group I thaumarchaeote SCGC AAA799-P11]
MCDIKLGIGMAKGIFLFLAGSI